MHFEDLNVWKRSSKLCVEILKELTHCQDKSYKSQITRSSLSVPSNIAEGFERGTDKDCNTFFYHAKGACAELQTLIHIGIETDYLKEELGLLWKQEAKQLSKMLSTLISSRTH
jgi:four helix bundle protein